MSDTPKIHVVLTGRILPAIEDWRERLASFDRLRICGVDHDGREIRFVPVDRPHLLRGLLLSSYEVHWSAGVGRGLTEAMTICRRRMAIDGSTQG